MTIDGPEKMRECQRFAADNIIECVAELLEWQDSAVLRDGKIRQLAEMIRPLDEVHSLKVAQRTVERAALEFVAQHATVAASPKPPFQRARN